MSDASILVVDDEPLNIEIIQEYLEEGDYQLDTAEDGVEAIGKLEANPGDYDVILLDRMMPRMNGLEVLERIKADPQLRHIPVILQTAMVSEENIVEGIKAGAYYYLTKPFEEEMLFSVVATAARDSLQAKASRQVQLETNRTLGLMLDASFRFRSLDEARWLAALLANACPHPDRVVMGLTELMINAVEHGNLNIGYNEKSKLYSSGDWAQEVERRLASAEFADKSVSVHLQRDDQRIAITIEDQGEGFEWQNYLEMSPDRAMDNHGRGIAMAGMLSFNHIEYQGKGNRVTASVELIGTGE